MTELLLLRHGETEWNRALRFQGQVDVPLNPVGIEQAQRLAHRLQHEAIDTLVCSDLQRAVQTALPLSAAVGLACVQDAGLREQNFGRVDGMRIEDIQNQFPEDWARWLQFDADFCLPGAESARQFHARVMAALAVHVQAGVARLAVVTHGGVLDMVYRSAMGMPLSGPRQCLIPNAAVNRLRARWNGDQWQIDVVEWADVLHLADMPPQPVYDQARLARDFKPRSL